MLVQSSPEFSQIIIQNLYIKCTYKHWARKGVERWEGREQEKESRGLYHEAGVTG